MGRSEASIRSYNHPKTSVSLVGLLVESLVLRHRVLGVDETVETSVRFSYDLALEFSDGHWRRYARLETLLKLSSSQLNVPHFEDRDEYAQEASMVWLRWDVGCVAEDVDVRLKEMRP